MADPFKYSKLFPRDMSRPTVAKDTSMYTHLAQISSVDAVSGTCTVRWITPRPGYRQGVLITHGSPGDVSMPSSGDYVLVSFDPWEQARIVGYLNLGQQKRVLTEQTLPEFSEGEKFYECAGSYVWVRNNGDVILSTASGEYLQLENKSGTLKSETLNRRHVTEAGSFFSGIIQRFTPTGTSIQNISRAPGEDPLTEMRIKIVETSDQAVGIQDLSNPLIDICFGTYVTDEGVIANKNGAPCTPQKELAVKISLKNGVKIFIDKEGRVSLENINLNINKGSVDVGDADISQGLEVNNPVLGKEGQKIARTHDTITIPLSASYTDPNYVGLSSKGAANMSILSLLASALMAPSGGGPCTLNSALLTGQTSLQGEITSGAPGVYLGDANEQGV